MSDLEEVDVEKQLKAAEESGDDTASIVLSEPEDDDDDVGPTFADSDTDDGAVKEDEMGQESDIETDDDKTYNVGDFVTSGF